MEKLTKLGVVTTEMANGNAMLQERKDTPRTLHVVFITAHPGDFEQKAGGTAFLLSRAGHAVTAISLTNGEAVSDKHHPEIMGDIRKKESLLAADVLGARHRSLHLPDAHIFPTLDLRQLLVQELRELAEETGQEADIVVTHPAWNDYMDDHSFAGAMVEGAVQYAGIPRAETLRPTIPTKKKIALYSFDTEASLGRLRQYSRAGVIVDVSDREVWQKKMSAFRAHESQREHIMTTITQAIARGHQVDIRFGEAFTQVGYPIYNSRNLLAEALPGYAYPMP